jgi:hypothetical protein
VSCCHYRDPGSHQDCGLLSSNPMGSPQVLIKILKVLLWVKLTCRCTQSKLESYIDTSTHSSESPSQCCTLTLWNQLLSVYPASYNQSIIDLKSAALYSESNSLTTLLSQSWNHTYFNSLLRITFSVLYSDSLESPSQLCTPTHWNHLLSVVLRLVGINWSMSYWDSS